MVKDWFAFGDLTPFRQMDGPKAKKLHISREI
jgi:hypothetical protein